jgi:predicted  nucleic acid-binding Zn-ribbon protein
VHVTPHVMCRHCGHVFSSDTEIEEPVQCPACGRTDTPRGVMRPTGFPTLDVFTRNWQRAQEAERSPEGTREGSSGADAEADE